MHIVNQKLKILLLAVIIRYILISHSHSMYVGQFYGLFEKEQRAKSPYCINYLQRITYVLYIHQLFQILLTIKKPSLSLSRKCDHNLYI